MSAPRYVVQVRRDGPQLRGAALALWRCRGPEVVISGPAETGKTYAALSKIHNLLVFHDGAQAVLVRKVRDTVYSTVLQTFAKKVLRPRGGGVRAYGGERPQWYDYPNGSRLWVAGLDDAGKALSSERDFVYVNQAEELTLDDWEVLTTRATGRAGNAPYPQVIGDCNPGPAHHWVKRRPGLLLLESRHEDNPTLYDAAGALTDQGRRTLAVLDALTGVRKERLRFGRWVSAEGAVYEFDARRHRLDDAELVALGILTPAGGVDRGRGVRFVGGGVDWGFTNPGALQVWAVDGDGRAYLVREWYEAGRLIDWWTATALAAQREYGVDFWACDPSEPAYITQFQRAGVRAIPGDNAVAPGRDAVQRRLQAAADGRARLFVRRGALAEADPALLAARQPCGLEQECDALVWKKYPDGRVNREETVGPDHAADAARYFVMAADLRSGAPPARRRPPPPPDPARLPDRVFGPQNWRQPRPPA